MPLTAKGETIKGALQEEYGEEKGERILYAGKNKGTFTGIDNQPGLDNPRDNTWPVMDPTQTLQIDIWRSGRIRVRTR